MSLCVFLASESHITAALPFCQILLPQHLTPSLQAISINYQNLRFLLIGLFLCLPFKYYHSFRRAMTLQSFKYMVFALKISCFRLCFHIQHLSRRQKRPDSTSGSSPLSPGVAGEQKCYPLQEHLALNQLCLLPLLERLMAGGREELKSFTS